MPPPAAPPATFGGRLPDARGQREAPPHAACRGCSPLLSLRQHTRESPAPRQHRQRVSAALPKKGKTQTESVQSRCSCCRLLCPSFRGQASRNLHVLPLVPGWVTLGPQPPRRSRQKRKGHQARERRPGSPKPQRGQSRSRHPRQDNCPVLVRPRRAKTSFPGRGPLRCAPWSCPAQQPQDEQDGAVPGGPGCLWPLPVCRLPGGGRTRRRPKRPGWL